MIEIGENLAQLLVVALGVVAFLGCMWLSGRG